MSWKSLDLSMAASSEDASLLKPAAAPGVGPEQAVVNVHAPAADGVSEKTAVLGVPSGPFAVVGVGAAAVPDAALSGRVAALAAVQPERTRAAPRATVEYEIQRASFMRSYLLEKSVSPGP